MTRPYTGKARPEDYVTSAEALGCACTDAAPCLSHFALMTDAERFEVQVQLGITATVTSRRRHEIEVNPSNGRRHRLVDVPAKGRV